MRLKSDLGRARGLGSAKEGIGHWWAQRLTALALVPLSLWFVCSAIGLAGSGYAQFKGWLSSPGNATLMVLFVLTVCHHAQLGVQVVVEDYVHSEHRKFATLIAVKLLTAFLAVFMVVSVLKVAVGV